MPTHEIITVLMPGEYKFSEGHERIQTLLGSCVAMVFWHPQKHIGAMCHYVLPSRHGGAVPDPRYADEFMEILLQDIHLHDTQLQDYQVRLFGAANMFRQLKTTCADNGGYYNTLCDKCSSVPCKNRIAAFNETKKYGFNVIETDLGGTGYRFVDFSVDSGITLVRKTPPTDTGMIK